MKELASSQPAVSKSVKKLTKEQPDEELDEYMREGERKRGLLILCTTMTQHSNLT